MTRTQVANYLCRRLPLTVQKRILDDEAFAAQCVPLARTMLTIDGTTSIDQLELFSAVRNALTNADGHSVSDLNGQEMLVVVEEGSIVLKRLVNQQLSVVVKLNDLFVFSPRREDRTLAVSRLLDLLGPTATDFSSLLQTAKGRSLNDQEAKELLAEASGGVAVLQNHARVTWKNGPSRLIDLVPDSPLYFNRFCGPVRNDLKPEEYFETVLVPYRRDLLQRDLHKGLEICLLGGLRDDLSPVAWVLHLNDDELWDALVACNPWHDPYSLLSALDICIARQHDQRYKDFAAEALNKLLEDKFPRSDSIDGYELLSLLIQMTLNRINMLEGGSIWPPYWKRMCAWMQGGFLLCMMKSSRIDLEAFSNWAQKVQEVGGSYAQFLDLHREPMYSASATSSLALRQEIVGRLVLLRDRHQAAGRAMPSDSDIDGAVARLRIGGAPLGIFSPGPLKGHRRTAEHHGRTLPEPDIKKLERGFSVDPGGPVWSELAYVAQVFNISENLLMRAREACSRVDLLNEQTECMKKLERLADGCLVAAAQRDVEFSRAISTLVLARATEIGSIEEGLLILQMFLIASGAFECEEEWANWLEEQLAELAARLPAGEITKTFADHLSEIRKVLPLNLPICSRAEAIALAAT